MYIRLCEGLADRGKLLPDTKNIDQYITNPQKDYYTSIYKYNEDHKKIFDKTGTIAGITDVTTNILVFDFDAPNLEDSRKDALSLIDRLTSKGISPENMEIAFSGNKGFHVTLNTEHKLTPEEAKNIAVSLAGDLKTFDDIIYNPSRVIRVMNTKNPKSNLYKTLLNVQELKDSSIDEIKDIAKLRYDGISTDKISLPDSILKLKEPTKKKVETLELPKEFINLDDKPKFLSPWKYALELGYFPSGQRSNALIILGSTYRYLGYNKTKCLAALKAAAELQAQRFNQAPFDEDEIKKTIINQVYSANWKGGTYSEENFPLEIQRYLTDMGLPKKEEEKFRIFQKTEEVFSVFQNFAENIDKNTIKTGIVSLDKNVKLTTSMLVGLLGAPSSGKTAIALEIMRNTSLNGEKVAFYSMDMGSPLIFQRLAQKLTGYGQEKLFDIFKNKVEQEKHKILNVIDSNYKNVNFSFKTALTVKDIKRSIEYDEQNTGVKTRLVVIDYLECISSDISDSNAKVEMISQQLKDLATDLDTCVLLLLQPPKRAGDPSHELLSYSDIKGAATIAQACSVVISLWREGFSPKNVENDKYMSFAVLKNRMGVLSQTDCGFNGLTGDVFELDAIGKVNLQKLRDDKDNDDSEEDYF